MRTFKNIGIEFKGNYATMNFLNCSIDVPLRYGGEVIASGCGSGKTTVIKDIIRQKYPEGVLYSASTIKECDEMYNWVIENLVNKEVVVNNVKITSDDVILLHSSSQDNNEFINNPENIANKLIVICTHYKLLHEYPELLLKKNFDIRVHYTPETGIRRSVTRTMNNGVRYGLPRQYVLIDELPTSDIIKYNMSKSVVGLITNIENNTIKHIDSNTGSLVIDKLDIKYGKFDSYAETKMMYDTKVKGTPLEINKGNTGIDQFRERILLELFYENYPDGYSDSVNDIDLKYNITDLILNGIETRFWLFDGTGDLTFKDSIKFNIRKVNKKYSSPINFFKFNNYTNRTHNSSFIVDNPDRMISMLDRNCEELINIINSNEKTLIVTWKDLRIRGDNNIRLSKSDLIKLGVNNEFLIPEYYSNKICNLLGINNNGSNLNIKYNDKEFSIIHYMSGLDKATNEFMDYDTVVFLGNFLVPGSVVDEFNKTYDCKTSHLWYTLYQLTQSVCRTRIRKHNGESINIYFSNDWDENYMKCLNMYLSNDANLDNISNISELRLLDKEIVSKDIRIKPKWINHIKILDEYDGNIIKSINSKSKYEFVININELYNMIPVSCKEIRKYSALVNYLNELGIIMKIESKKVKY